MKNQRIQGSLLGLQLCLRLSVDEQKAARFNEPTNWAEKERTIYGFFGNSSLHHFVTVMIMDQAQKTA
ncbi:unnamed protein product [Brassica oleracea]